MKSISPRFAFILLLIFGTPLLAKAQSSWPEIEAHGLVLEEGTSLAPLIEDQYPGQGQELENITFDKAAEMMSDLPPLQGKEKYQIRFYGFAHEGDVYSPRLVLYRYKKSPRYFDIPTFSIMKTTKMNLPKFLGCPSFHTRHGFRIAPSRLSVKWGSKYSWRAQRAKAAVTVSGEPQAEVESSPSPLVALEQSVNKTPCDQIPYPESVELTQIKNRRDELAEKIAAKRNLPSLTDTINENKSSAFFPAFDPSVKEVVYALDVSKSVFLEADGKKYIEHALEALLQAVTLLEPDQKFNVILFASGSAVMFPNFKRNTDAGVMGQIKRAFAELMPDQKWDDREQIEFSKYARSKNFKVVPGYSGYESYEDFSHAFRYFTEQFGQGLATHRKYVLAGDYAWTFEEVRSDVEDLTANGKNFTLRFYGDVDYFKLAQLSPLADTVSYFEPQKSDEYYEAALKKQAILKQFPDIEKSELRKDLAELKDLNDTYEKLKKQLDDEYQKLKRDCEAESHPK